MARFLPTLRGGSRMESKVATPVALAQYYAATAGLNHQSSRDWPIERAVAEGYDRVMWVFKSVNTISADTARLPFRLREGIEEDAPTVDDHPLYRVLNQQANPLERGPIFRKRLSAQILLSKKGAFVECTKSNAGSIIRLDLLPPDRITIVPDSSGGVSHYELARRNGGVRNLDPQNVRWFRDPHPIDPYMGTTPLESAGMSIELDHFARVYNVAFLRNDGRPGGILAVRDTKGGSTDIDPAQMDRIEQRFGKGPVEAGKLSVVAGALDYVDLAAKPRDMQYGTLSSNARMEILGAFGIGESVFGNAAGRTFDNADNELYVYWTRTLPPHHDIFLTGFDEDSEDNLHGFLDTSKVEILERAAKERRREAREEVGAGVRSIFSYAQLSKQNDIESTPHTRALYIPTGKTPLPSNSGDAEALGMGAPIDPSAPADSGAPALGGAPATPALPPGQTDAAALPGPAPAPALNAAPTPPETDGETPAGAARAALRAVAGKELIALRAIEGGRPKVVAAYRLSRKAAAADPALYVESTADEKAYAALERDVTRVLSALTVRWTERAAARVGSPKQRKGTRHWTPEYANDVRVGVKALDTAKAVDEETWQAEAEKETHPLVLAAAVAAATALMADVGVTPPPGVTLARMAAEAVTQTVAEVVSMIGRAAANQARRLSSEINRLDQNDLDITAITDAIRDRAARLGPWCETLAVQVATATINGGRDDGAVEANRDDNVEIERAWTSRRDDRVRHSHHLADGQVRGLDEPFIVGSSLLMRPGDPTAPVHETAGCRCRLKHRSKRTGRFVADPGMKALPRDADGDGMVFDGTPMQRPAPPRNLRIVADPPVARPTPADTPADVGSGAPTSMTDTLIAKGAARIAKYRAKAREWQGTRIPPEASGFKPWNAVLAENNARNGYTLTTPMSEDESRALIAAMYANEWTTRSGRVVRSEPVVDVFAQFARVVGNIIDVESGDVIGSYKRQVALSGSGADNDRKRQVTHDELLIVPEAQGEGIGGEFNAHSMAFYREHGIESIKITAGGSTDQSKPDAMNGGYVWSTQGFDFDRSGDLSRDDADFSRSVLGNAIGYARIGDEQRMLDRLAFLRIPASWLGESDNLASILTALRQIDPADPPTPYEMSMIGADRVYPDPDTGLPTWFGKAAMTRTSWTGKFDLSWLDAYPETKGFATGDERGRLLAAQMMAALGDDTDTAAEVLVSGMSAQNEDAEREAVDTIEAKAARQPRDGDSDGFVFDGTVRQMPTPLRSVRGNEAAIARGAGKVASHARQAADWHGHRFGDLAAAPWRDAEKALTATFAADFTTVTGRVVRTEVSVDVIEPGAYGVYGRFYDTDSGEELGQFERDVMADGPDGVVVAHAGLTIEPWAQGEGIATEFNAHAFAWYRHMGVDEVVVNASGSMRQASKKPTASGWTMTVVDELDPDAPIPLSVALNRPPAGMNGGYTWGQAGFDWKNASFLNTIPGTMLMAIEAEPEVLDMLRGWDDLGVVDRTTVEAWFDLPFLPPEWWDDAANRAMLLRFLDTTDYNAPPTPFEINQMGAARPHTDPDTDEPTWFGKAIMSRSSWYGFFDPKWLDAYIETKARKGKGRREVLAAAFLAALGADEVGFEEKSVRALGSLALDALLDEGEIELGLPRRALRRGSHPRDGDGDGLVYDGTPRQRPARPRTSKPTYTTPAARGSMGSVDRATAGRPYAETLERTRTRKAEAEQRALARAAARTAVYAATRKPVEPSRAYLVGPGEAAPWDDNAGPTEGMSILMSRLAAGPMAAAGADVRILDRLVEVARGYDEAKRDNDTLGAEGYRERLLALLARLRDLTKPNGDPVVTEEDLGVSFADIMSRITRNAKSVYTGRMMKTLHRGEPRDADGDGFVDDGKPTMRPITRRTAARWARHPDGWLSRDGEWFLERMAPMAGGRTNAWAVMHRAPADRIGRDGDSTFRYDTSDGQPLTEVNGTWYVHEADAGSLAEAKLSIESLEAANVEENREDYEAAGYDAAQERFEALSVEQMRVARDRARVAVDAESTTPAQRESLHGAIRWLTEHLDAADGLPADVPDPDPHREAVYKAERELLAPMDRMRAITDDEAAAIASQHVGEDVTILRTDEALGGLEKGKHIFGVWLSDGPVIAVPATYALSPFEVYHETAHLLTSRGDDLRGHGEEFQREYLRILPDALANRLRPGFPAVSDRDDNDERFKPTAQGRVDGAGTEDDPIDVQGDLDLAARLIADGKHVRLNRVDQIGTFVTKLAALVRMAEERGDTAPTYDLCKVSVPGTNLFCKQSKGIPRVEMPQLSGKPKPGSPADDLPRNERGNVNVKPLFRDWLIANGHAVEEREVDAAWLKASQHQLDGPAVGRIYARFMEGQSTGSGAWTTRDGYIVDGHHQWAAQVAVDADDGTLGEHKMTVQVIDLEIGEALTLAHAFSAEQGIIPSGIGVNDTARARPEDRVTAEAPVRDPNFGKRIGVPERRPLAGGGYLLVEKLQGSRPGQVVERVIFRVERRDGVWGVYPPTEQSPADFTTGSKAEADRVAMNRALGKKDPVDWYAELRATGRLLLTPEEREDALTVLRRLAKADGLQVVAGFSGGQRGLTRDQQRRRPTEVALVRPDNPSTIYAPDA